MDGMILLPDSQEDTTDANSSWNEGDSVWNSSFTKENGKHIYSSFSRVVDDIELFTVQTGDFVYVFKFVVQVKKLWETVAGEQRAMVQLFFYPRQTRQRERPYHGKAEILPSDITVKVPIDVIQGKVSQTVENFNLFTKLAF